MYPIFISISIRHVPHIHQHIYKACTPYSTACWTCEGKKSGVQQRFFCVFVCMNKVHVHTVSTSGPSVSGKVAVSSAVDITIQSQQLVCISRNIKPIISKNCSTDSIFSRVTSKGSLLGSQMINCRHFF